MRAAQTYLTKFPATLVSVFPELSELLTEQAVGWDSVSGVQARGGLVRRGIRLLQDPKMRRAIEEHAVREATRYYLDRGADRVEELGKPYDLRVIGLGREIHVKVKGSSVAASAIELTANEVTHAHNHKPTDLVVVDQIGVRPVGDGEFETTGGRLQIWRDWEPEEDRLVPTQFRYTLKRTT